MVKAFNRMFSISNTHGEKYINSSDYEYRKTLHSKSMIYKNPSHNMTDEWKENIRNSWTPERRQQQAKMASQRVFPKSAKDKLSKHWLGVPKPKKEGQVDKNIKSSSTGKFITPFGTFDSPGQAERSESNENKLSRYIINKLCKDDQNTDFRYIPNGKKETRGLWKRKMKTF